MVDIRSWRSRLRILGLAQPEQTQEWGLGPLGLIRKADAQDVRYGWWAQPVTATR